MSNAKSPTVEFIDNISEIYKAATADTINGVKRKTLGDCLKEDASRAKNKIMRYFTTDGAYDDNIEIPSDTRTLTGEPFSTLYGDNCSKKTVVSTNGTIEILNPKTDYNTEMYCSVCKADERSTYDALSPRSKIVYELTLLTKKMSNDYNDNKISAVDARNQFQEKADEYKAIAEKSDLNWKNILMDVSCELQQESINYRKNGDMKNLDSVNLAHNLFVTYNKGEDEYFKSAFINIDGSQYDNTLKLNNSEEGSFWDKCKNGLKKAKVFIHSLVYDGATYASSGWSIMKTKANSLANKSTNTEASESKEQSVSENKEVHDGKNTEDKSKTDTTKGQYSKCEESFSEDIIKSVKNESYDYNITSDAQKC